MRLASSCTLMILLVATSLGAQSSAPRPAMVEAEVNEARGICRDLGGVATFAKGGPDEVPFETRVDLNGDRLDDYIFDYQGLSCSSADDDFIDPGMCGSAGCAVALYLSGRGGYAAVPAGNIQGWQIDNSVDPPRLRVEEHGSACGQVGADTCVSYWGWNGRTFGRLPARAPSAGAAAAAGGTRWTQSVGANGYRVAAVNGLPPPVAGIAITCERNVPMIGMNLGRRSGQSLAVSVATAEGRADMALMPIGATGGWAAPVRDPHVLDLLSGSEGAAQVTIAGQPAGAVPLAGAREAMDAALAGCYRPGAMQRSASQPPAGSTAASPAGSLADAERFVDMVYREIGSDSPVTEQQLYTPEFAALSRRWYEGFDKSGEEGEPTDPLCDTPVCGGVRLVSRSVRALPDGRAEATVRYNFPEFQTTGEPSVQTLILERTPDGWRIADIVESGASYAAGLRDDLARWEGNRPR